MRRVVSYFKKTRKGNLIILTKDYSVEFKPGNKVTYLVNLNDMFKKEFNSFFLAKVYGNIISI